MTGEASGRQHAGNLEPSSKLIYHSLRKAAGVFFRFTGGLAVEGLENLPRSGRPFLIAPNHEDWMDIPVVGHSAWQASIYVRIFAREDLMKDNFLGNLERRLLESAGATPIKRAKDFSQDGLVDRLDHLVEQNAAMTMFPQESRRNHLPYEIGKEVKTGAALMAMSYGLPIVPAGIAGTREKTHMGISYGTPLEIERTEIDLRDPRSLNRTNIQEAREITETVKEMMRIQIANATERRKYMLQADK